MKYFSSRGDGRIWYCYSKETQHSSLFTSIEYLHSLSLSLQMSPENRWESFVQTSITSIKRFFFIFSEIYTKIGIQKLKKNIWTKHQNARKYPLEIKSFIKYFFILSQIYCDCDSDSQCSVYLHEWWRSLFFYRFYSVGYIMYSCPHSPHHPPIHHKKRNFDNFISILILPLKSFNILNCKDTESIIGEKQFQSKFSIWAALFTSVCNDLEKFP